jgi:tetratricopeptide (TPR) repeat protein
LRAVGQRHATLEPAQEAVDLFRELAARFPNVYLTDLAMTLNNLSTFLGEVGKRQEALATAQEAVAIRRGLVELAPDVYGPGLASALQNLAICLGEVGKRQEALAAGAGGLGHSPHARRTGFPGLSARSRLCPPKLGQSLG